VDTVVDILGKIIVAPKISLGSCDFGFSFPKVRREIRDGSYPSK